MDRVLIGPFDIIAVSQFLLAYRWAEDPEQWTGNRRFIFSPPLVSRFAQNAAFASLGS